MVIIHKKCTYQLIVKPNWTAIWMFSVIILWQMNCHFKTICLLESGWMFHVRRNVSGSLRHRTPLKNIIFFETNRHIIRWVIIYYWYGRKKWKRMRGKTRSGIKKSATNNMPQMYINYYNNCMCALLRVKLTTNYKKCKACWLDFMWLWEL